MTQNHYHAALQAGLPPLVARIASIVAEVEGPERASRFIEGVREEDDRHGRRGADSVVEKITPIRDSAPAVADPLPMA